MVSLVLFEKKKLLNLLTFKENKTCSIALNREL